MFAVAVLLLRPQLRTALLRNQLFLVHDAALLALPARLVHWLVYIHISYFLSVPFGMRRGLRVVKDLGLVAGILT